MLAESNSGETFTAFGAVDLAALRAARRAPGMNNFLARQRTALFAAGYPGESHQQANGLIQGNDLIVPDRDYFRRTAQSTIARLEKDGLI